MWKQNSRRTTETCLYFIFFIFFRKKKNHTIPGNFVRVKQNELPVSAQGLLTKACHTALTEQMRVEEHM